MATPVLMPKQGNTVETCLILKWRKQPGDSVQAGDILCDVETDKATFEVETPAAGTLLETYYAAGTDVPVLKIIAAIGQPGEDLAALRAEAGTNAEAAPAATGGAAPAPQAAANVGAAAAPRSSEPNVAAASRSPAAGEQAVSPRARKLAESQALPLAGLAGSGPGGRVIERDVQAVLATRPPLTPAARAAAGGTVPAQGSGIGGRVVAADLTAAPAAGPASAAHVAAPAAIPAVADEVTEMAIKGIRKLIADRMLQSLQTTAQLTLNASADARALQAYRARLKNSEEALGLRGLTINDLVLLAVARVLARTPELNATCDGKTIRQFRNVHLAFAVDTPRGLMVPVIRNAHTLGLKALGAEAKRLGNACQQGGIDPDLLQGGTFTVTNLGAFGIESFTPVLNVPQVAILGVGGIQLKPVAGAAGVEFIPHLGLSLTINHQVVDGAPAARFLQALAKTLAAIDLELAM